MRQAHRNRAGYGAGGCRIVSRTERWRATKSTGLQMTSALPWGRWFRIAFETEVAEVPAELPRTMED